MSFVVLSCTVLGVAAVAFTQRIATRIAPLERIGGALIVAGLVGLGITLVRGG